MRIVVSVLAFVCLTVAVSIGASSGAATPQPLTGPATTTGTTPEKCGTHLHRHSRKDGQGLASRAWRGTSRPTKTQRETHDHHVHCASSRTTRQIIRHQWARHQEAWKNRRFTAKWLPYPGPNGTHWAIPWSIVSCESGGSWSAYNSSGAAGPYQLMREHNRPWPVDSEADKRAHHKIASALYAGGNGRSNWVC